VKNDSGKVVRHSLPN